MSKHEVPMRAYVVVEINDRDVVDRCVNNAPFDPNSDREADRRGWRDNFYDLRTEQDVLEHLAYNALYNGIYRVNRLDGWGDLGPDAATMRVVDVTPE